MGEEGAGNDARSNMRILPSDETVLMIVVDERSDSEDGSNANERVSTAFTLRS